MNDEIKREVKIYLDGKKVASISKGVSTFGWGLKEEEMEDCGALKGVRFDGKKYYVEVNEVIKRILSVLPSQWYSVIWDSDDDFLITNEKNRKYLTDLFFELKRLKELNYD